MYFSVAFVAESMVLFFVNGFVDRVVYGAIVLFLLADQSHDAIWVGGGQGK